LDQINDWISNISARYPSIVTVEQIGVSYEKRPLRVVRITGKGPTPKKGIMWEGGIHAREWIAHATMCFIINQLVTYYGVDNTVTRLVDNLEWSIVPVVNPDGYVYTWTTNRNWRKTRSPNAHSPCIGTDPNRNWDDHWCEQGASTQPCSDSYCGSAAFSEVEVKSMANYVKKRGNIINFVDWHSYSQLWMAPYGWSSAMPPDAKTQADLGQNCVEAIKETHGMIYGYGTIYDIIYPASGSSADWGYDFANVTYSYGVELRDTGEYGFLLPADQIIPQGEEIWSAAIVTGNFLLNLKTNNGNQVELAIA